MSSDTERFHRRIRLQDAASSDRKASSSRTPIRSFVGVGRSRGNRWRRLVDGYLPHHPFPSKGYGVPLDPELSGFPVPVPVVPVPVPVEPVPFVPVPFVPVSVPDPDGP